MWKRARHRWKLVWPFGLSSVYSSFPSCAVFVVDGKVSQCNDGDEDEVKVKVDQRSILVLCCKLRRAACGEIRFLWTKKHISSIDINVFFSIKIKIYFSVAVDVTRLRRWARGGTLTKLADSFSIKTDSDHNPILWFLDHQINTIVSFFQAALVNSATC